MRKMHAFQLILDKRKTITYNSYKEIEFLKQKQQNEQNQSMLIGKTDLEECDKRVFAKHMEQANRSAHR